MKRILSLILAIAMCMAMNGNSIASASGNIAEITEYKEIVAVDVVDVNGNLLGTVDMPRGGNPWYCNWCADNL